MFLLYHPIEGAGLRHALLVLFGEFALVQLRVVRNLHHERGAPLRMAVIKLVKGVNDLATLYPKVAAEWNYEKTGILGSSVVSMGEVGRNAQLD